MGGAVYGYQGEGDPDAELVRFTITRITARKLPNLDGHPDQNDPYVTLAFNGSDVARLPTLQDTADPAWDTNVVIDVPLPYLMYGPGNRSLTITITDEDTQTADDKLGHATLDLPPLPMGATSVETRTLINPEVGDVTVTIHKAMVPKALTLTTPPLAGSSGVAVPRYDAGGAINAAWTTSGLISRVVLRLTSVAHNVSLLMTPATGAWNDNSGVTVTLPAWLKTGDDYMLRVWDQRNASVGSASVPIAVRGASIAVPAPADGVWYLGMQPTATWSSFGSVAAVTVSLHRGGSPGSASASTLVATLASNQAGTGSVAYSVPMSLPPAADYRLEVSGDVVGVRTAANSSGFFAVKAVGVVAPVLVSPPPAIAAASANKPGMALAVTENVTVAFTATSLVANMRVALVRANVEVVVLSASTPNNGAFTFLVPDATVITPASGFSVRVTDVNNASFTGESGAFTITPPTVGVTFVPDGPGADLALLGSSYVVQWLARGPITKVNVQLMEGGSVAATLASAVAATQYEHKWVVGLVMPGSGTTDANGRRAGFTLRVSDATPSGSGGTGASGASGAFGVAPATDMPGFPVAGLPPTVGETITLSVRSRPAAAGAHTFVSLMQDRNAGVAGATPSWKEVAQIAVVSLPTPTTALAPITRSFEWPVPVAGTYKSLAALGKGALALRLRLLDRGSVLLGQSAPFGLLMPAKWVPGAWGACDAACGPASRTRVVDCKKVLNLDGNLAAGTLPASRCVSLLGAAPPATEACSNKPCDAFGWQTGDWGVCSAQCGGGTQTREVACVDDLGNKATAAQCSGAGAAPAASRTCNRDACETFSWVARPWSTCTKECGGGRRYRSVQCVGSVGTVAATGAPCAGQTKPATAEDCGTAACAAYVWQVGDWSTCSVACGGGTATRSVACLDSSTLAAVADAQCDTGSQPAGSRACNTATCVDQAVFWQAGAWSACSLACGGGSQTRSVACVDSSGAVLADESKCSAAAGTRPEPTAACNTQACGSPCDGQDCDGHGTCSVGEATTAGAGAGSGSGAGAAAGASGTSTAAAAAATAVCTCESGWQGSFCTTPVPTCSGELDSGGTCCAGLLMAGGQCCGTSSAAAVDRDGACCAEGNVDPCGVCGGEGKALDAAGECCGANAAASLDGAGLCCNDAEVDACGVCGGDGRSCEVVMTVTILPAPSVDVPKVLVEGSTERLEFEANTFPALFAPILGVDAARIDVMRLVQTNPPASRARQLAAGDAERMLTITFRVKADTGGGANAGTLIARMHEAQASGGGGSGLQSVDGTSTAGVCGNKLCEFGEVCSTGVASGGAGVNATDCCPADCPLVHKACAAPAGSTQLCGGSDRGVCVLSTGTCRCWAGSGYTGADCGACAIGFMRVGEGATARCVPVFDVPQATGEEGLPVWAIAIIAILGAGVGIGLVYVVLRSLGYCAPAAAGPQAMYGVGAGGGGSSSKSSSGFQMASVGRSSSRGPMVSRPRSVRYT